MKLLLDLAHRVASNGSVYDAIQMLAGAHLVRRRLKSNLYQMCRPGNRVLDVGGGTGRMQDYTPPQSIYYCLDLEMPKLLRYSQVSPVSNPMLSDATRMAVRTGSIDLVMCTCVAHHLTDEMLTHVLNEARRVLRTDGRILLLDAVDNPRRWTSRFLWRLDRGSHPKTIETLERVMRSMFQIEIRERFAIYHEYLLCVGRKS
jgi:ubiquinone/menaquinone biosynthesis C-methylase UbiE